jgi:DNA-binding transcriptional MerR regulator
MRNRYGEALGKHASVTVEAAARLVDVDIATIRHWSDVGSLEIEQRGDMDVVRLDQVRALTTSPRRGGERTRTRHGAIRALLRDAAKVESLSVSGLQQMVREKAGERALGSTW